MSTTSVFRDGDWKEISRHDVIPGDIVRLFAGSIFDFLTFFALLRYFHASQAEFHTGWFVESLATQTLVRFVIRTLDRMNPSFLAGHAGWVNRRSAASADGWKHTDEQHISAVQNVSRLYPTQDFLVRIAAWR
ncbi:MAG TPA: hypothetical protein VJ323_18830 [Bryobacteraceae bacterium]|nr:hypothetical protein [Bryobacteraceae bacterium]